VVDYCVMCSNVLNLFVIYVFSVVHKSIVTGFEFNDFEQLFSLKLLPIDLELDYLYNAFVSMLGEKLSCIVR
jgi:hypothetical protein